MPSGDRNIPGTGTQITQESSIGMIRTEHHDSLSGVRTTQEVTYNNSVTLDSRIAGRLKRNARGLIAAVVQQYDTKEVLMVGYMNDEAIRRTLTTGRVTFWSRSRQEYWRKGDTSGHVQYVKGFSLDCDGDAALVQVDQVGAACHTGKRSCFDAGGPLPVVEGYRKPFEVGVR